MTLDVEGMFNMSSAFTREFFLDFDTELDLDLDSEAAILDGLCFMKVIKPSSLVIKFSCLCLIAMESIVWRPKVITLNIVTLHDITIQ